MSNVCHSFVLAKIGPVSKGTFVVLNFYNLHRWKHIWGNDADDFNPYRWLSKDRPSPPPYAFLPFSSGPRMCLGYQYATVSIKTALIYQLSHYKFNTHLTMEDLKFKFSITMKLVTEHLVQIEQRRV